MHLGDELGTGVDQQLVAALEVGAPEVVRGQVVALQPGSGCAVEDDDLLTHEVHVRGRAAMEMVGHDPSS